MWELRHDALFRREYGPPSIIIVVVLDRLKFLIGFAKLRLNRWLEIKVKVSKLGHVVFPDFFFPGQTSHMAAAREIYLDWFRLFRLGWGGKCKSGITYLTLLISNK